MDALTIAGELKDFVLNQLITEDFTAEIDLSTPLFELRILDSLAVVTVLNFINGTFDVSVPLEELTADNLRNLESIGHLVARLSATSPAETLS